MTPFTHSLDTFLRGPHATKPLEIDEAYAIPFAWYCEEYADLIPSRDTLLQNYPSRTPSTINPQFTYVHLSYGTILYDTNWDPIGAYLSCALSLSPDYQGQGLGRELVIQTILNQGFNPVWDIDAPQYSTAGLCAHVSAWRHMQPVPKPLV